MKKTFLSLIVVLIAHSSLAAEKVLYLARHGETGANVAELLIGQTLDPRAVLTETGQAHAKSLAELLANAGIRRIYVSRLKRTHQTAEPLAKKLSLNPLVRSQLDEFNFGAWESASLRDPKIRDELKKADTDCLLPYGGAESRADVVNRVKQVREELLRDDTPSPILVVAHFGTLRSFLEEALQLSCSDAGGIMPANDTVYRLTWNNGQIAKIEQSLKRGPFEVTTAQGLKGGVRPGEGPHPSRK